MVAAPPMPTDGTPSGWAWFEAYDASAAGGAPDDRELCPAFARCFAGADGQMVLDHLKRGVLERRLPPHASDAELLLHRLQHRADLLHRLADLFGVGFQGARPVIERFALHFDDGRVRRSVFHAGETLWRRCEFS